MSTTLKRSVSELLDPNPPQVALDLRNQPDAKRARTMGTMDPNHVIDLCHSQSMETPLPSPTLKSTIVEAPVTPERKEHKEIDWEEYARTHTTDEFLKAYSQHYTMEDHVLETTNVGNDVVVTGVKEVIPVPIVVPMIPFTQVDEPVEDDEASVARQQIESAYKEMQKAFQT